MSNVNQIVNELLVLDSDISTYSVRLERECGEITNSLNKVQSTFGDQQAGQSAGVILYKTIQKIVNADNALHITRQEIKKYVQNIQK